MNRLAQVAVAMVAGFVVLVLLFPGSGNLVAPPTCYSVFGYVVPCGLGLSLAAGAVTTGVVGLALWASRRR